MQADTDAACTVRSRAREVVLAGLLLVLAALAARAAVVPDLGGAMSCTADADCDDGDVCTLDGCFDGVCGTIVVDFCTPCDTDLDCNDGNNCNVDRCAEGRCSHSAIEGCTPCATATACSDGDPCTDDVCNTRNTCEFHRVDGCIPCDTAADCTDGDACTSDACGPDGSCLVTTIPGCVPCETASECRDGDPCTRDACRAGACANPLIDGCRECMPMPEVCGDGVDNDCDGARDCSDTSCRDAPVCAGPAEICGDCLDNDGDGFVDLDDPECGCGQPDGLALERLRIHTRSGGRPARLEVKGLWADAPRVGSDPRVHGLTLQVSDDAGMLLCTTFDAERWQRRGPRRLAYRQRDDSSPQDGPRRARLKVSRHGRVLLHARGPHAMAERDVDGDVGVKVLVGDRCNVSRVGLRATRRRLVFP